MVVIQDQLSGWPASDLGLNQNNIADTGSIITVTQIEADEDDANSPSSAETDSRKGYTSFVKGSNSSTSGVYQVS